VDAILLSIHPNDPLWIAIAFVFGLLLRMVGLPPLIGFLVAGFLLHALGAEADEFLYTIADMGITILLFSIGLKLRPQALARVEVWGVASIHMGLVTLMFAALVVLFTQLGLPLFVDLDLKTSLLIGFVLSFSSTVFAIKRTRCHEFQTRTGGDWRTGHTRYCRCCISSNFGRKGSIFMGDFAAVAVPASAIVM
jgi:predicted Kef-type K+ transport protein